MNTAVPGTRVRNPLGHVAEEQIHRERVVFHDPDEPDAGPASRCSSGCRSPTATTSGNQPPCRTLIRLAPKKAEVHDQEQRGKRLRPCSRLQPHRSRATT